MAGLRVSRSRSSLRASSVAVTAAVMIAAAAALAALLYALWSSSHAGPTVFMVKAVYVDGDLAAVEVVATGGFCGARYAMWYNGSGVATSRCVYTPSGYWNCTAALVWAAGDTIYVERLVAQPVRIGVCYGGRVYTIDVP